MVVELFVNWLMKEKNKSFSGELKSENADISSIEININWINDIYHRKSKVWYVLFDSISLYGL